MAKGKTISMFLMDNAANGRIKASISNWNGLGYRIPRDRLTECKDIDAMKHSGVYILFGSDSVYVGQAEVRSNGNGIHQRIIEHQIDRLKDNWDEVVIFTTKDNSFGRTDISYLENLFCVKTKIAGRYTVENGNTPSAGTVTEEKAAELEEFAEYSELILGAMGYKVFEPRKEKKKRSTKTATGLKEPVSSVSSRKPSLPSKNLGPCAYAKKALDSLYESGYEFTEKQIQKYSSVDGSKEFTRRNLPMFWILNDEQQRSDLEKNVKERYWKDVYTSGEHRFLMFSQWYRDAKLGATYSDFDKWYSEL